MYLTALKHREKDTIKSMFVSISNKSIDMLIKNKISKALVRPLFKALSAAQNSNKILDVFDKMTYTKEAQDIYLTTAYCLAQVIKSQR